MPTMRGRFQSCATPKSRSTHSGNQYSRIGLPVPTFAGHGTSIASIGQPKYLSSLIYAAKRQQPVTSRAKAMPGCVAGLGHAAVRWTGGKKDICSNPDDAWRLTKYRQREPLEDLLTVYDNMLLNPDDHHTDVPELIFNEFLQKAQEYKKAHSKSSDNAPRTTMSL